MAGTKAGCLQASKVVRSKYGDDFYSRIGRMGGRAKVPKGFALMPKEEVSKAGKKGGRANLYKKKPRKKV